MISSWLFYSLRVVIAMLKCGIGIGVRMSLVLDT